MILLAGETGYVYFIDAIKEIITPIAAHINSVMRIVGG